MYVITLSVISFLNEPELIHLHTRIAIVSTQLNGFNYCSQTPIIQFNINHLFAQEIDYKYCYLTLIIQFNITQLFTRFKYCYVSLTIQLKSLLFYTQ